MLNELITVDRGGYQVRSAQSQPIGEIEGGREKGFRLYHLTNHPNDHGFLPAEAVDRIDRSTNTVHLVRGITVDTVVDAPPPPGEAPEGWRNRADWSANLRGHYGLFESAGHCNEQCFTQTSARKGRKHGNNNDPSAARRTTPVLSNTAMRSRRPHQ